MNPPNQVEGYGFTRKKKKKKKKQKSNQYLTIGGVSDGEFFFDATDVHFGGVRLWQASRVFFNADDVYSSGDRLWQASRDIFTVQRQRIASFA
ncbi:unnamed protein product [Camellia sinensis]